MKNYNFDPNISMPKVRTNHAPWTNLEVGHKQKGSQCQEYHRTFSRNNDLDNHQHTQARHISYRCLYCFKIFAQAGDLKKNTSKFTLVINPTNASSASRVSPNLAISNNINLFEGETQEVFRNRKLSVR